MALVVLLSLSTCLRPCELLPLTKSQLIGPSLNASLRWSMLTADSEHHEITKTSLSDVSVLLEFSMAGPSPARIVESHLKSASPVFPQNSPHTVTCNTQKLGSWKRTPPPSSSSCGHSCGGGQWRGLQRLTAARAATTRAVVAAAASWRLQHARHGHPWHPLRVSTKKVTDKATHEPKRLGGGGGGGGEVVQLMRCVCPDPITDASNYGGRVPVDTPAPSVLGFKKEAPPQQHIQT